MADSDTIRSLITTYLGISILLLLSAIIRRPIRGHAASFTRLRLDWRARTLAIPHLRLVMPSMVVSPRATAPAPHNVTLLVGECKVTLRTKPRLALDISLENVSVTSPLASFTLPRLTVECPILPFLPFTDASKDVTSSATSRIRVTFHRLRIRVFSSKRVPYFIRIIRAAVMRTMLFGSIARADYARIDIVFGPSIAPSIGPAVDGEEAERKKLDIHEEDAVYHGEDDSSSSDDSVESSPNPHLHVDHEPSEDDATSEDEASEPRQASTLESMSSILPILKPVKKLKERFRRKGRSTSHLQQEHEVHEVELPRNPDASASDERSSSSAPSEKEAISSAKAQEQPPETAYDTTHEPRWAPTNDDLLVTKTGENLVLHDHGDRLYTFRSLSAGLRRRWSPEIWVVNEDGGESIRGSGVFEMEVEDARWIRASEEKGVRWACEKHDLGHVHLSCSYVMIADLGLCREEPDLDVGLALPSYRQLLYDPMSAVDLRFIHSQVSFDRFRIRDAELSHYAFESALHFFGMSVSADDDT